MSLPDSRISPGISSDSDVLKKIILKLQKRVQAGATTLLVKVKTHRGDPLNEEVDIRAGKQEWDTTKNKRRQPNQQDCIPMDGRTRGRRERLQSDIPRPQRSLTNLSYWNSRECPL
jgi:hypothetical protein